MAHRIAVSVPEIELANRDLIIVVSSDGEKLGELRISKGGLDWWPKDAKTKKRRKTWAQLKTFMEA